MTNLTYWPYIFMGYLALFSLGLLDNARSPYFVDIMTDLSLSNTQGSLFFAVVSGMAYIAAQFVPRMVARFTLLNSIRFGLIIMGVGFGLLSQATGLLTLVACCVVFGLGFGIINVAQNLLILEGASLKHRRRLLSGLHGMYAFSSLISPLIAAQLFRLQVNWRTAYLAFAALVLFNFVVTFLVKRKSNDVVQASDQSTTRPKLKFRSYALIGTAISLYIMAELMISTRIPLYVREVLQYSPEQAANLLAAFFFALCVGRFLFLFVHFRTSNIVIIEIAATLTFVVYALGLWVHPWFLALTGLTMAPIFGLSLDMLAEIFHEQATAAISAVIGLSCVFIVSMHLVMGLVTDWMGIAVAMRFGLICLVVTVILLQFYKKKTQDKIQVPA